MDSVLHWVCLCAGVYQSSNRCACDVIHEGGFEFFMKVLNIYEVFEFVQVLFTYTWIMELQVSVLFW